MLSKETPWSGSIVISWNMQKDSCEKYESRRAQELKKDLLLEFMQATLADEPMRMPRIAGA